MRGPNESTNGRASRASTAVFGDGSKGTKVSAASMLNLNGGIGAVDEDEDALPVPASRLGDAVCEPPRLERWRRDVEAEVDALNRDRDDEATECSSITISLSSSLRFCLPLSPPGSAVF